MRESKSCCDRGEKPCYNQATSRVSSATGSWKSKGRILNLSFVPLTLLCCALGAGPAAAQEEVHCEGMSHGLSISAAGNVPAAMGLVTALYAPLTSYFASNEYTWEIRGLVSLGSTSADGVTFQTEYDVTHATMTIYEDPSQDARSAYYNCPAGMTAGDPAYTNGSKYLTAHFVSFSTTYDLNAGLGGSSFSLNWDGGEHLLEVPPSRRGVFPPGAQLSFSTNFACIPLSEGYSEQMTARFTQASSPSRRATWGSLRRLYR